MFSFIKKIFDQKIKEIDFIKKNEKKFKGKDGTVSKYQQLDTSISNLRRKYANLKVEWRRLTDRCKNSSGLSPENESKWFCILNEVSSETNSEMTLAASSQDLSFNLDVEYSADEDEDQREEDISDHGDVLEEDSAIFEEQNKKEKTFVAPHKKTRK